VNERQLRQEIARHRAMPPADRVWAVARDLGLLTSALASSDFLGRRRSVEKLCRDLSLLESLRPKRSNGEDAEALPADFIADLIRNGPGTKRPGRRSP